MSRYGITTVFCAPQCRPLENYTRGLRPEVTERCPSHILERLGFAAWSSYGHTGADVLTLASMLRIPVYMHNVPDEDVFRPSAWSAFGSDANARRPPALAK